jgi:FkbM family methyltransferase
MSFTTHAQNFEDVLLWRALCDVDNGRYLDIGAQDPVEDSVSLLFYEQGWRGIHVEPSRHYADKLRTARPDEVVVEAAVSDEPGPITFYEIRGTGMSTGDAEVAAGHREKGFDTITLVVPTIRLDRLLEMAGGELHWLKVDVEGMEDQVLRSWGDNPQRPWVLVIEATYPNSQIPTEHLWINEVLKRGYEEVFFDGLSRYFVHEDHSDLSAKFAAPANVFDQFLLPEYHFAARSLRNELRSTEQRAVDAENMRVAAELDRDERLLAAEKDRETQANERLWHEETMYREHIEREQELRRVLEEQQREIVGTLRAEHEGREKLIADALKIALQQEADSRSRLAHLERYRDEMERQAVLVRDQLSSALAQATQEIALSREQQSVTAARFADELQIVRSEAGQQSAEQQAKLSRALHLMNALLNEETGWWQRLGGLFGVRRASPARQAISDELPHFATPHRLFQSGSSDNPGMKQPMPSAALDESRNPYLRAESLSELVGWHDAAFVRCAYVTVLGRQPDPSGESYYTAQLRDGVSKLQILWELRNSGEGRDHDPGIAGFDRTLRRYRMARLPVIGPLLSHRFSQEWTYAERRARRLENETWRAHSIQSDRLIGIGSRLDDLGTALRLVSTGGGAEIPERRHVTREAPPAVETSPDLARSDEAAADVVSRFSQSALLKIQKKLGVL